MDFAFFLLLNVVLFIRPGELVPFMGGWPVYLVVFLACIAVSPCALGLEMAPGTLKRNAISACVIGLFAAVVLSLVSPMWVGEAGAAANEFIKPVLYYLLLICVVNSMARLRLFLLTLAGLIVAL